MAFEIRQQYKLSQQLHMTPMLQQAINLLLMSRQELVETVQHALLENPMLEEVEPEHPVIAEADEQKITSENDSPWDSSKVVRDASWEEYLDEFSSRSHIVYSSTFVRICSGYSIFSSNKPNTGYGRPAWKDRFRSI